LTGSGTLNCPVVVQAAGTLAPGASIGTLTINNTLSLAGNAIMEINKNGAVLTNDQVKGISTLTCGGTLTVLATGDALALGDSFQLFAAASYAGSFASLTLPPLDPGLVWDTSRLTYDGSIIVTELKSVSIQVELEAYEGLLRDGNGSRPVIITASGVGNTVVDTWTQTLNFTNRLTSLTLSSVKGTTLNVSVKTPWHLRKRLMVNFSGSVNFVGPDFLRAGDVDGSNTIGLDDYHVLASLWYQATPVGEPADIDGNGVVDLDDYFILSNRWGDFGDPQ
jgi:hypothetical protein